MKKQIDLRKRFKDNICSFDIAKKAAAAGMTCANTFYAYDEHGELTDGAWLAEGVEGVNKNLLASLPNFKAPILFPAINLPMAIGMLEDTDLEYKMMDCYFDEKYFFRYAGNIYKSNKLVDLLVEVWIKHKK